MEQSFVEKRMRELGLTGGGGSSPAPSATPTAGGKVDQGNLSFTERRMMELGIAPDIRPQIPLSADQQHALDVEQQDMAQMDQAARANDQILAQQPDPLPGRNLPVIGSVLKGLDWFGKTPAQHVIADLGQMVYTPGASGANIAGLYGAAESAISKYLPNLAGKLSGKVAQEVITGAPLGAGQAAATGHDSASDLAQGAAFGAAGGAVVPLIGRGVSAGYNALRDRGAFRQAIDEFMARTKAPEAPPNVEQPINGMAGDQPAYVSHPSERIVQDTTPKAPATDYAANFKRGGDYQKQYEQAVQDQYAYLKQSMADRGGVDQGGLIKDPTTGEVINRYGRTSNNPKWYQDFYAENGRKPTDADLRKLSEQHVQQGFQDESGQVPAWKPDPIQEIDQELQSIRDAMPSANAETRKSLEQTAATLQKSRNELKQSLPEGVQAMRVSTKPLPQLTDNYHKPLSEYTDRLYRETNGEGVLDLLPGSNVHTDTSHDIFMANKPEMALGQGKNKGILIEFDSGNIKGQVNKQKPGWEMAYKSGDAEFVAKLNDQKTYQDAVRSVTISKDAVMDKPTKLRLQRTLSNWEKQVNPDGSVTYLRPNQAAAVPEGVQPMRSNAIPFRQTDPNAVVKKPITRQQLLNNAKTRFGIPIRTGRLGESDPSVLGYYKTNSQVIRSRAHGDIQVISHEIGHHLDNTLQLAHPQFDGELMALGRKTSGPDYTPEQIRAEGIAEFMRLHLTDPATAEQAAPNFAKFFEGKLDRKTAKAIQATQQDVANWIDQGPAAQFRGQVNRTGKDAGKTVSDRIDTAYTAFLDKLHPLSVAEQAVHLMETGKAKLYDASQSLYKKARLFAGAPKKAQLILNDLKQILKPLDKFGYSVKDLGDYAAAKHALELENAWQQNFKQDVQTALQDKLQAVIKRAEERAQAQGRQLTEGEVQRIQQTTRLSLDQIRQIKEANRIESGFTREQIKAVIQKFDTPEMNAIQKRLVTYNNNLLDMLVNGEVLSQEAVDAMRKKYGDYVPFYRFFDEDVSSGFGGKGFADLTNPVKRMKGSTRDIIDPIESMIKNTFAVVNAVEKNKVGLELARLSHVEGSGQFIERLQGAAPVSKENIVTVFQNGERAQFQLEPDLYRAIKQLDDESSNALVKLFSYPSSMLRAGATLTPEFILRNPIRDQFQAFVTSNFGYNPIIDLPMGMFHVLGRTKMYKQWIAEGGGYGNTLSQDRNYLREQLKTLKDERNPWARRTVALVNPKEWLHLLRIMGEFTEEATKVGEFRKGINKGATTQEAAYQSRDLMDFARVGNSVKQINRVVTFLNANLQGKDKLARAFKANPVRTTVRAIEAVTLPAVGIYYWNKQGSSETQRQTLDNAPQWMRDTFFLISIPGTDVVARIPKPFDLAPVFANIPEQILRWIDGNQPQKAGDFAKGVAIDLLKVPYMMTGLTPLIENATNYSFFTGGPIVPRRDQDLLPQDQYGVNTSLTARAVGNVTGTSPYKVDNLIRGYGAGLGKYATAGSDKLLELAGVGNMPPAEKKKVSELPVINAFTVDNTGGGKAMDDFYKLLDKASHIEQSNKKNHVEDSVAQGASDAIQKDGREISKIRAQYRDAQGSYKLSSVEKRKLLDELNAKMNSIATDSTQKYQSLVKR